MELQDHVVPPDLLRWTCDPAQLSFETTEELPPLDGTVGQERAVNALTFGLEMEAPGFNLFIAGPSGTGRASTASSYVNRLAGTRPTPDDWCYVHNFKDPTRPVAIRLPSGQAPALAEDMSKLIKAVRRELRRLFESRQYRQQQEQAHRAVDERRDALVRELSERAQREGFAFSMTPAGPAVVPIVHGRPMVPEELSRLDEQTQARVTEQGEAISRGLLEIFEQVQQIEREVHERMAEQDRRLARSTIEPLVREIEARYPQQPRVAEYLAQVQEDLVGHVEDLRRTAEPGQDVQLPHPLRQLRLESEEAIFERYRVNVLVDNHGLTGAPVVVESNPTYYNLLGRIEYRAYLGAMVTDFSMIKAGALQRANGGYLVLDALDLLSSPFAWDMLKRVLRDRQIKVENISEQFTPVPAATLRPDPIPLDVKVILIGAPNVYYLLYFLDEDFPKLFRVRADFDTEIKRSAENLARYAAFISGQVRQLKLLHFHRTAVAKVAEHGARLIEHQGKLSGKFQEIADLVAEASHWASRDNSRLVMAAHVTRAIKQKAYRSNLVEEKIRELIDDGTLLIDTTGEREGQVNGLSILDVGDHFFGRPVRITAQTALGTDGVVNIERETRLSGRLHNKAFLILTSFLMARYAQDKPLALAARITFEQTYDEVEGDSASCAELCALLSSIAAIPLRQDIAITGSVNQRGEIQAIGGVTRKIEGFFDVCRARGLTGQQGVIIPASNVKNLMLREEVVEAAREGSFRIWAVRTLDEAMGILAGLPAGQRQPDRTWEPGSVNARVDQRLRDYAARLKDFGRVPEPAELRERAPADIGPRTPRLPASRHAR